MARTISFGYTADVNVVNHRMSHAIHHLLRLLSLIILSFWTACDLGIARDMGLCDYISLE